MRIMKSLLNNHNQNIIKEKPQSTPKNYNCLKKENYPMNGLCLTESLLYYTTIRCAKKIILRNIRVFVKQFLKNATQTMKSLLMFQPKKTIPNFLPNIRPLKQSLAQTYHGKSKEDTILTISFPEDLTCA